MNCRHAHRSLTNNLSLASIRLSFCTTADQLPVLNLSASPIITTFSSLDGSLLMMALKSPSKRFSIAALRWPPKTGQVAKRESPLGTAAWPKVRHGKYTEEAQS